MNNNIKIKNITGIKLVIAALFFSCCLSTNIRAQEIITDSPVMETPADKDWKVLSSVMRTYGTVEEYRVIKEGTILEKQRYYDKYLKKRSQLAKAFWDKYPKDVRHDEALYLFFNANAEPFFIPNNIPDNLIQVLNTIPIKEYKKINRLLPIDHLAREQWLKAGDDMVSSVLHSNASLERKEAAEFQLIAREFRYDIKLESSLQKENSETEYWNRFEIQYWQHIRLRLEQHVNKYATLEIVAARVQTILNLLQNFSTAATEVYWNYFFETTGASNPLADQPGIMALHKLAAENVAAIEALKEVDYSKPLDMVFTAIDGSIVDLNTMRGKVVLIDFWAT
ncbi:hypothetical protein Q4Q35_15505, partial [Flavivirga aquimarina]